MPEPYDVITMGRIGVDLYPLEVGVPLARVETFGKFLGGSPANVAVAAARQGRRTAVITRTGEDPFGAYLHQELERFGVDPRWATAVAEYPTPVTFCEIFPPDDFPLYFYRRPKAPDLEIHAPDLDLDAVRDARIFWMTGTGLSAEPSRSATLAALRARSESAERADRPGAPRRTATVFDLDWRPMFWDGGDDSPEAPARYREALAHATVAVGNVDECAVATGEREPYAAARALLAAGVELAVVKQGPKGVLAVHRDGTTADCPPLPVEVVNGLGAGDAFGGALCHGLLAGWPLDRIVRYANAAGAIVASRLACSSAMPFPDEVEEALAAGAVTADLASRAASGVAADPETPASSGSPSAPGAPGAGRAPAAAPAPTAAPPAGPDAPTAPRTGAGS
ncbi:5-keto-2-deoxygluconokinase (EC [Streptomyces globisporus]|uniref:5-keto-2-deoxygluconokinase (EC) n=1 Tax=Streptomyces globisporus TaxID=1908 RepID=A0ABM9GST6_STRGL|nr:MULTISPECIES: 5-dehydro-2-deoxygluconokinase [Streptomyces]RDL02844.1 5-dehydro-2-deoxygluconokinase [Streptomyces sp. HB202]WSF79050.1 5-dehydro-2-deoxygluconokinase [Streptomyces globisporus]CAH9414524.1 5-keto-2-deoxygluconokinase (EC [Streptomyces globisporus]